MPRRAPRRGCPKPVRSPYAPPADTNMLFGCIGWLRHGPWPRNTAASCTSARPLRPHAQVRVVAHDFLASVACMAGLESHVRHARRGPGMFARTRTCGQELRPQLRRTCPERLTREPAPAAPSTSICRSTSSSGVRPVGSSGGFARHQWLPLRSTSSRGLRSYSAARRSSMRFSDGWAAPRGASRFRFRTGGRQPSSAAPRPRLRRVSTTLMATRRL